MSGGLVDRVACALEGLLKGQAHQTDTLERLLKRMHQTDGPVRENAYKILVHDATATTEQLYDVADLMGGNPASSLTLLDAGGAMLEVSLNGGEFFTLREGEAVDDFTIGRLRVRATTAGSTKARFWIGYFIPKRC